MHTADIRRRVTRTIAEARVAAAARRRRAASAEAAADAILSGVAAPLCKTIVAALKAEGLKFRLSTPPGAVRISSETSGDDYIELALDATRTPPALMGRVGRAWGRRVLADEQVVAEDPAIGELDEETLLEFVLGALAPFVER